MVGEIMGKVGKKTGKIRKNKGKVGKIPVRSALTQVSSGRKKVKFRFFLLHLKRN